MRKKLSVRHTLRFRRWSRKAYAAFVSIGRCVTIGCLRKSIADCSLSKQKATGANGRSGCREDSAGTGTDQSKETDIGIPLGNSRTLTFGIAEPGMNRQFLFRTLSVYPCACIGKQEKYIIKLNNNSGTDHRSLSSFKLQQPEDPCFFLYPQT